MKPPGEVLDPTVIYAIQPLVLGPMQLDVYIEYLDDDTQREVYVGSGGRQVVIIPSPDGQVQIEPFDPTRHKTQPLAVRYSFVIDAPNPAAAFMKYEEYDAVAFKLAAEEQVRNLIEMAKEHEQKERSRIVTPTEAMGPPGAPPSCLRKI